MHALRHEGLSTEFPIFPQVATDQLSSGPTTHPTLIFLGGIFTDEQQKLICENSIGVVQNAADSLQKKLLSGLAETYPGELILLNLPFVSSYPRYFKLASFPSSLQDFRAIKTFGPSFNNCFGLRVFSRFLNALRALRKLSYGSSYVVIVYSAHLPFILAACLTCAFRKGGRVCAIIPDLPEFMSEGGMIYRFFKAIDVSLFYRLSKRIDRFVLLTRFMAERIGLSSERYIVVEGVADGAPPLPPPVTDKRIFLYTGTLASRYGVNDLIDAFSMMQNKNAELWICGDGDSRDRISKAAELDRRITFHGQVSRKRAEELQRQATILVNPRASKDEFTKYSFPSKTMEYLAASRPVLMHRLAGIPDDYRPFLFFPDRDDVTAFAEAMDRVAQLPNSELARIGAAGRNFVIDFKNPKAQAQRILDMLSAIP